MDEIIFTDGYPKTTIEHLYDKDGKTLAFGKDDNNVLSHPRNETPVYVSHSGQDTASGDSTHPVATIGKAIDICEESNSASVSICLLDDIEVGSTITKTLTKNYYIYGSGRIKGAASVQFGEENGLIKFPCSSNSAAFILVNGEVRSICSSAKKTCKSRNAAMPSFSSNVTYTQGTSDGKAYYSCSVALGTEQYAAAKENQGCSWITIFDNTKDWVSHKARILSFDDSTQKVTFNSFRNSFGRDALYAIENAPAYLADGTFYCDGTYGYYMPLDGESVLSIEVPVVNRLLELSGEGSVIFASIAFYGSDYNIFNEYVECNKAVQGGWYSSSAINIGCKATFYKCSFLAHQSYCIGFYQGSDGSRVECCDFINMGCGAIKIGECNESYRLNCPTNIVITRNTMSDNGLVDEGCCCITLCVASDVTIEHNDISNTSYSAISAGCFHDDYESGFCCVRIRYNKIKTVGCGLTDGAAIYCIGHTKYNEIVGNLIDDTYKLGGIYLDEYSNNYEVRDNIISNKSSTSFGALNINSGHDNYLHNNIVYNCDVAIRISNSRSYSKVTNYIYKNIFCGAAGSQFTGTDNASLWGNIVDAQNPMSSTIHTYDKSASVTDVTFDLNSMNVGDATKYGFNKIVTEFGR